MNANGYIEYTGRKRNRLCLVLDCLIPHDFSSKTSDLINLQHYVIKEKKLSEKEAVIIFADIVRIVESLHKVIFFSFLFFYVFIDFVLCLLLAALILHHTKLCFQ